MTTTTTAPAKGRLELVAVAKFDEYRVRQVAFDKIVVEIGGRESLTEQEMLGLHELLEEFISERLPAFFVSVEVVRLVNDD